MARGHRTAQLLVYMSLARLACAAMPDMSGWQWQRTVRPAEKMPAAEQCVVLDADFYHNGASGLRDVRLVQDGRAIPYAMEESYDEKAHDRPFAGEADRALYTTVLRIPLQPSAVDGKQGNGMLPARVPVERIVLDPATPAHGQLHLELAASPLDQTTEKELIRADLDATHPVEQTAIGANLQSDAKIAVRVEGQPVGQVVLLQMHQRAICFQPLSRSPLTFFLGNSAASPVRYEYASSFHPSSSPLLATLAPAERNPSYTGRAHEQSSSSVFPWRLLAILMGGVCSLWLTGLLWKRKI